MADPVFEGMPTVDREFSVGKYGIIRCGGPCKDDYARINLYHDDNGRIVKLQEPALQSFKDAEYHLGRPIVLTGSWRSCDDQLKLWQSDKARFAPPNISAHCRGLAIDVWYPYPDGVKVVLENRHWFQARPTTEPWHFSFGIEV